MYKNIFPGGKALNLCPKSSLLFYRLCNIGTVGCSAELTWHSRLSLFVTQSQIICRKGKSYYSLVIHSIYRGNPLFLVIGGAHSSGISPPEVLYKRHARRDEEHFLFTNVYTTYHLIC